LLESIEYIRAGKLRALAVTTATRSEALPDIPTVGEFVPGYETSSWLGVGVPRNTPVGIIDTLNKEINAGLADPKLKARLPQKAGGSASALSLSRPAQALLTVRPTGSLSRPRRPLSRGSSPSGHPAEPLVSYQTNRQFSGWILPPQVIRAFGAHGLSTDIDALRSIDAQNGHLWSPWASMAP
jgi:Tripartite tricarboxylate transporter family receptor